METMVTKKPDSDIRRFEFQGFPFHGKNFSFYNSPTLEALVAEIFHDNYHIFDRGITIGKGDYIVDIGANEGIFAIMMAKMFPDARVLAFEPVPRTFFQMIKNIGLNGCLNIDAHMYGFGKTGEVQSMNVHKVYSGGSSLVDSYDCENHERVIVDIRPIDILMDKKLFPWMDRIKLMKMDIEGGEYDALYGSTVLPLVDYFVGEFHINSRLQAKGYDMNELATWVGSQTRLVFFERCKMNE